ncbi:hypothetical protein Nocox_18670 [Nonomuraea coxensis DSM 45129]|uniref:Uncharacterized protein n=1 Tax=Nonomuraea coxensis DSM 45129 TaxID=1122611 RepID=A0ABX8U103_9ACTN|nr:hypothetical protein [Nonomuraea coxensis]QYC41343.1 hypothetical protein Nocox_18670 [Nonomuraea coxensis DSM 45129]
MLDVLGAIGSLLVVLLLIAAAIAVTAVIALAAFVVMAGSMVRWRHLWRRLTGRERRLTVKLSGERVPERRRGELSGRTPRLRRHFPLEVRRRRGAGV